MVICNNLLTNGECILGNHCRYKHFPELSNNITLDYKRYVPNLNLIPLDTSFNWSTEIIEKDKEALSMLVNCFNTVSNTASNKEIKSNYESTEIKNTITGKNRLPIFVTLSNKNNK